MTIYIAFLRGINVGKQKIIKMDHLKSIFESLQFQNVKTYIQSGNVIFATPEEETHFLCQKIERKLKDVLGYEVTVVLRTISELEDVIRQSPFVPNDLLENERLYVTFLSDEPTVDPIDMLISYKNNIDELYVMNRTVYILCRKGYGRSLFSNNFLEKKLKVLATTRNWETVNKIASIIRE